MLFSSVEEAEEGGTNERTDDRLISHFCCPSRFPRPSAASACAREPSRPARAQCVLAGQNPYFPYWSSDRLIPRSLDCFEDVHALGKAILGMVYLRMLRIHSVFSYAP